MKNEVTRTEVDEVRWTGTLDGEHLRRVLLSYLIDSAGAPSRDTRLLIDGVLPDISFELVHDNDWL